MNGDFSFSSLHNMPSWVCRLVGQCGVLPVSVSTRTVNPTQKEDCDIAEREASAAKRRRDHVLVVH